MRHLLLSIFLLTLCACGPSQAEIERAKAAAAADSLSGRPPRHEGIHTVMVDGCKYVVWYEGNYRRAAGSLVHAGDCPNPIHHNDTIQ